MSSLSPLPWIWVIETLADVKETDTGLLKALIARVPEFLENSCKEVRERVAFRYLQEWLNSIPGDTTDEPLETVGSNGSFDVSESVEEVLCRVLEKVTTSKNFLNGGLEQLKLEVQKYLLKKRPSLPKATLCQLKDSDHELQSSLMPTSSEQCLDLVMVHEDNSHALTTVCNLKESDHDDIILNPTNLSFDSFNVFFPGMAPNHLHLNNESAASPNFHAALLPYDGRHIVWSGGSEVRDGSVKKRVETLRNSNGYHQASFLSNRVDKTVAYEDIINPNDQNTNINFSLDSEPIEQRSCVKCVQGGELLVCTDGECSVAVHEVCLGMAPLFDETGNFFCPHCAYLRAKKEYHVAKIKVSCAWKALTAFLGRDQMCENSKRSLSDKVVNSMNQQRSRQHSYKECTENHQSDNPIELYNYSSFTKNHRVVTSLNSVDKINNSVGDHHLQTEAKNTYTNGTREENELEEPCNSSNNLEVHKKQVETSIDHGKHAIILNPIELHESERITKRPNKSKLKRRKKYRSQKFHNMNLPCEKTEDSSLNGVENMSLSEKRDTAFTVKDHQEFIQGKDHEQEENVCCHNVSDPVRNKSRNVAISEEEMENVKHTISAEWKVADVATPPSLVDTKLEETDKKQDAEDSPTKLLKRRKPDKRYAQRMFPFMRRTKLLWSPEEEEALVEAVQKLSNSETKNLPWTQILESGGHIFHRTRTPTDLKDKWRNIAKRRKIEAASS